MKDTMLKLINSLFPAIAGTNVTLPYIGAMPDQAGLITALNGINPFPQLGFIANNAVAAATLTGAAIGDAQLNYVNMTGVLTGNVALTLPTATLMLASFPATGQVVGASGFLRIINSSTGAYAWTVTTAAGWTLNGTMAIAQNTFRDFVWQVTAIGANPAIILQQVGTGTTS